MCMYHLDQTIHDICKIDDILDSDITIRKATLADREAVLAINDNVFDGRDYLPALYDSMINSPNTQMFVLLLKDKTVS